MSVTLIRAYHRARPFRPFVIHVTDGRKLRVRNPWRLAQGRAVFMMAHPRRDVYDLIEAAEISRVERERARPSRSPRGAA